MNKSCSSCNQQFDITEDDLKFYSEVSPVIAGTKIEIPSPTHCPTCRQKRRLSFRNERNLYHRKCDLTGKNIISVFSSDKPYKVYDVEEWYKDSFDPLSYGRDFDFSRPFFEQFDDLIKEVPQMSRSVVKNENSDFVNQAGWNKNCYLCFEADYDHDCYFSSHLTDSVSTVDCLYCDKLELCYGCINCQKSYNLKHSENCINCSNSAFMKDCIGCSDCIMCVNLRNKKNCIYNKQYNEEEYKAKEQEFRLNINSHTNILKKHYEDFVSRFPQKSMQGTQNQNCTGNYISNSKNCHNCFDILGSEDSNYLYDCRNTKRSYDISVFGSQKGINFSLDCHEIGDGVTSIYFSEQIWNGCHDIYYSKACLNNCSNLFGCISIKQKSYCILNKQYTKEEYEELVPRIITHMKETGEFGEFFPKELSLFGYNETLAQEYFPLTKDEVINGGYKWSEADNVTTVHKPSNYEIPDDIKDTEDDICDKILSCEVSSKPFKLVSQELKFYKKMNIAVPRISPNERHFLRMKKRSPRVLRNINCAKCNKTISSATEGENIYCKECFEKEVY